MVLGLPRKITAGIFNTREELVLNCGMPKKKVDVKTQIARLGR